MSLRWEVRCTACEARAVVEAMIPFARIGNGDPVRVDDPEAPISGFWEDYICPDHLIVARRAVWVAERDAVDPIVAWERYRHAIGHTTPIPRCPQCGREMSGGQWIADLPLHLAPHIELGRWVVDRWADLERLLRLQQRAVRAGDLDHATALAILREEATAFNTFHDALRRQLRLSPTPQPPFEWYQAARWSPIPDEWSAAWADLDEHRRRASDFLAGLQRRQAAERDRPRPPCPVCGRGALYLYERFAG